MTRRYHSNNYFTTLASTLSSSATTMVIASATGLPTITANEVYRLTISQNGTREIVEVTARTGTTLTITRAMEGTTAQVFVAGANIELRVTANSIDRKADMVSTAGDVLNFGDATSLEIPNNATATLANAGEIALDTSVTDYVDGVLCYRAGSTDYGVIAIPKASLASPTNNYVVTYDSTTDNFKLAAGGGGGGGSGDVVGPASATDNAITRFDTTTGKLIQNSGASLDDNNNIYANNLATAYATTATVAGTTTLTIASAGTQFFTGSTTQTVTLPVVSTLPIGHRFHIINKSSGIVTVNSSGANAVQAIAGGNSANFISILNTGTTAASWGVEYIQAPSGGGITDGDKGDITVASSGTVWTIDTPGVVTFAANDKILVKDTSASDVMGYVAFSSITALANLVTIGTITTGVWNGSVVGPTYGGTGQSSVTAGDLLYGNGVNTWGKLAKDTNSTRYLSNQGSSNAPSWNQVNLANGVTGILPAANGGDGYNFSTTGFSVSLSSNQSISGSTYTKLLLNTEAYDNGSFFDNATNYRFQPTIAGKYLFLGSMQFGSVADTTQTIITLYKNGSGVAFNLTAVGSSCFPYLQTSAIITMNGSTDYVELYCYQSTAGSVIAAAGSSLSGYRVGA